MTKLTRLIDDNGQPIINQPAPESAAPVNTVEAVTSERQFPIVQVDEEKLEKVAPTAEATPSNRERVAQNFGEARKRMSYFDQQRALRIDELNRDREGGALDDETYVDVVFSDPELDSLNQRQLKFQTILKNALSADVTQMEESEAQAYFAALVEADPRLGFKDDYDGTKLFGDDAEYGRANLQRLLSIYTGENPNGLFSREAQKWFQLSQEQKEERAKKDESFKQMVLDGLSGRPEQTSLVESYENNLMEGERTVQFAALMAGLPPMAQQVVLESLDNGEIEERNLRMVDPEYRAATMAAFRAKKGELDANWWLTQGAAQFWDTSKSMVGGTWSILKDIYLTTGGRTPYGTHLRDNYEREQLFQLQIADANRNQYKDNLTFGGEVMAGLMGSLPYMLAMSTGASTPLAVLGMANDARERMILSGVDHDTAQAISIPVGVINGWIEKIQWNGIFGKEMSDFALKRIAMPRIAKMLMNKQAKYAGAALLKSGKEMAITTITEDIEEILQQMTEDIGVQLGRTITFDRNEFNIRELVENAWDVGVESFPTTFGFGLLRGTGIGPAVHGQFSKRSVTSDDFVEFIKSRNAALEAMDQLEKETVPADQKSVHMAELLDDLRNKWTAEKDAKKRFDLIVDTGLTTDQAAILDKHFMLEADLRGEVKAFGFYDESTDTYLSEFDVASLPKAMKSIKSVTANSDGTSDLKVQIAEGKFVNVKMVPVERKTMLNKGRAQFESEVAMIYDEENGEGAFAKLDDEKKSAVLKSFENAAGAMHNTYRDLDIKVGGETLPWKSVIYIAKPDYANKVRGALPFQVGHEIFHVITRIAEGEGVINDADIAKLRTVFGEAKGEALKAGYTYNEEGAADEFGDFLVGKMKDTTGIWQKIKDFFVALYEAMTGRKAGEPQTQLSADAVFEALSSGNTEAIRAMINPQATSAAENGTMSSDGKVLENTRNQVRGDKAGESTAYSVRPNRLRDNLGNLFVGNNISRNGQISSEMVRRAFELVNTSDENTKRLFNALLPVADALGVEYYVGLKFNKWSSQLAYQQNGRIVYFLDKLAENSIDNDTVAYAITHELIHGVTAYAIESVKQGEEVSSELKDAVNRLENLYTANRVWIQGLYGATDVYEFIAELSNHKLRERLENRGLLRRIVEAIADAIRAVCKMKKIERGKDLDKLEDILSDFVANIDAKLMEEYQFGEGARNSVNFSISPSINEDVKNALHFRDEGGFKRLSRGSEVDFSDGINFARLLSIPNAPVVTLVGRIRKFFSKHHLSEEQIADLPNRLEHPVAVFEEGQSYIFLTDLIAKSDSGEDKPVVVMVKPKSLNRGEVLFMTTALAYGSAEERNHFENFLARTIFIDENKIAEINLEERTESTLRNKVLSDTNILTNRNIGVNGQTRFSSTNSDIRFSILGEQGVSRLNNAAAILDNLSVARQMLGERKWGALDIEEKTKILYATGWEMGGDGKWRFETPDLFPAAEPRKFSGTLREYFESVRTSGPKEDYKSFFKAYPAAENIHLVVKMGRGYGWSGFYRESDNLIELTMGKNTSVKDMREAFAHEVQHFIQHEEGFAEGGNTRTYELLNRKEAIENAVRRGGEDYREFIEKCIINLANNPKTIRFLKALSDKATTRDYSTFGASRLINLGGVIGMNWNKIADYINEDGGRFSHAVDAVIAAFRETKAGTRGSYRRLAGEVEAYNMMTRLGKDYEWRRENLLESTEDVARESQIYYRTFEDGMRKLDEGMRQYGGTTTRFSLTPAEAGGQQKSANTYYPDASAEIRNLGSTFDDNGNPIPMEDRGNLANSNIRFSLVTDEAKLKELEEGETMKVYRAMQLIDGKLYPPMSAKVDGKWRQPIELGKWEQSEERPDLIKGGKFTLNKGNKSSVSAAYNPYFHTSNFPLNDQFSTAYKRPELVTVEVEIPVSELTSGYKAEGAKDAVGKVDWHSGSTTTELGGREVYLSRYDKPVRIVPEAEVAKIVAERARGKNATFRSNTVTPKLKAALEAEGIIFDDTQVRFSIADNAKALILKKRPDIVNEGGVYYTRAYTQAQIELGADGSDAVLEKAKEVAKERSVDIAVAEIMKFPTLKAQKAALHWFIKGAIRLPEDAPKVIEAMGYAEHAKGKANNDFLAYPSPMAMIEALHEFKPKAKRIDPDTVPELSDKREFPMGVTTYLVQDDRAGQEAMRRIINTHWGEDANPWCLLHGDGKGNLTDGRNGGYNAARYWKQYSALPKRVAFRNGKLLAFMATDESNTDEYGNESWEDIPEQWWDRQDAYHNGIPLGNIPVEGDPFGRWADYEIRDDKVVQVGAFQKGAPFSDDFVVWYANGFVSQKTAGDEYFSWDEDGSLDEYRNHKTNVRYLYEVYRDGNWYVEDNLGKSTPLANHEEAAEIFAKYDQRNQMTNEVKRAAAAEGSTAFSVSSGLRAAGLTYETDENGELKIILPNGKRITAENPATWRDLAGDNMLTHLIDLGIAHGTVGRNRKEGEAIKQNILASFAECFNLAASWGAMPEGISAVDAMWRWLGDEIFKAIKSNSDSQYGTSVDILTICKKTDMLMQVVSEYMKKEKRGAMPTDIMELYLATGASGFQTPCPVCYVFSRWIRAGYDRQTAWEAQRKFAPLLVKHDPKTAAGKKFWKKEFDKYKIPDPDKTGVPLIPAQKAREKAIAEAKSILTLGYQEFDKAFKRNDLETARKINKAIKKAFETIRDADFAGFIKYCIYDADRDIVWNDFQEVPSDILFDFRAAAEIARNYPALRRFYGSKGSAGGKAIETEAQNDLGDIAVGIAADGKISGDNELKQAYELPAGSKERAKMLSAFDKKFTTAVAKSIRQNLIGGQRFFSWSDNRVEFGFDMMMNLMQIQILGDSIQSYSKQLEGAELLTKHGAFNNGSLMGEGAGYEECPADDPNAIELDGKYYRLKFSTIQGINAEKLFELNNTYDKSGNILVGMNDNHIRIALRDKRVFFIIPWHASGLGSGLLDYMLSALGEDAHGSETDYSPYQNDKFLNKVDQMVVDIWDYAKLNGAQFDSAFEVTHDSKKLTESQKSYRALRQRLMTGKATDADVKLAKKDAFLSQVVADLELAAKRIGEYGNRYYVSRETKTPLFIMGEKNAQHIYPYEYWDRESTYETSSVNSARYLEYCRRLGVSPKFCGINVSDKGVFTKGDIGDFHTEDNYWQLLVDRRMYKIDGSYQHTDQVEMATAERKFDVDTINPETLKAKWGDYITKPADPKAVGQIVKKVIANQRKQGYALVTDANAFSIDPRVRRNPNDLVAGLIATKTRRGEKVTINEVQELLKVVGGDPNDGIDLLRRGQSASNRLSNIVRDKAVSDDAFLDMAMSEAKKARLIDAAERYAAEGYKLGAEDERTIMKLAEAKAKAAQMAMENATGFAAIKMELKYGFNLVDSVANAKRTTPAKVAKQDPLDKPGEVNGEGVGLTEMMEEETEKKAPPAVVEAPEAKALAELKAQATKRADQIDQKYGLTGGMSPAQKTLAEELLSGTGEGDSPTEKPIKKTEIRRDQLDFNRASDFLAFVEEVVARELDKPNLFKEGSETTPSDVRNLANTARCFLKKIASKLMYSFDRENIMRDLEDFQKISTLSAAEAATMNAYTHIQDRLITETQNELIDKLIWQGNQLAKQGVFFSRGGDERDRKVLAKVEEWWRMVSAYLRFSDSEVEEETIRLKKIIEKRQDTDADLEQDLKYRMSVDLLNALTQYGGLINKKPGEIADKSEEILSQLKGARFELENRREDQYIRTRMASEVLRRAVVNPKAQKEGKTPNPSWVGRLADSMMGILQLRLRDLIRYSTGETRRRAEGVIQDVEDAFSQASQKYNVYLARQQAEIDLMLKRLYGSAKAGVLRLTEKLDDADRKSVVKQMDAGEFTRSWILQRYVELGQTEDYAQNISQNGRNGKWRDAFDKVVAKYISSDDLAFVVWMRDWYRKNLRELNEQVLVPVSGIEQYSPDENYFPVKVRPPTRQGVDPVAKAWSPLPSWLTPRVPHSYDFDERIDLLSMWYKRMRESSATIAYAQLGLNVNDVLLAPELKDSIRDNHGDIALRRLSEHLSDIISGGGRDLSESDDSTALADRLRAWQTNLTLSGNYVSALKQTVSECVYGLRHDIDLGMVAKFMTDIDVASIRELMASDGWKSRYSGGITEQMQNAIRQNSGKGANFLNAIYNAGFKVMELGDAVPCVWVGQGLYRYFLAQIMDKEGGYVMSEMDAKERALARTWAVIEMTQQSKRTENLTAAQRGGKLGRFLYQFASSPVQQLAYEVQAIREAVAAAGTDHASEARAHLLRVLLINHVMMPNLLYLAAVIAALPLGKIPEKDDQTWDFIMRTIMGQYGCIFLAGLIGENTLNAIHSGKYNYKSQGLPVTGIGDIFQQVGITFHDLVSWDTDKLEGDFIKMLKSTGAPARHAISAYENWATEKGQKRRKKALKSWQK